MHVIPRNTRGGDACSIVTRYSTPFVIEPPEHSNEGAHDQAISHKHPTILDFMAGVSSPSNEESYLPAAASSILPLPPALRRTLPALSHLPTPDCIVKELVDNALDARATSITVVIAGNTIDRLSVTDNGSGVAKGNWGMLCRAACSSKLFPTSTDGGYGESEMLGFRGDALSSMLHLCGGGTVTTRTVDEECAKVLKYDSRGELVGQERASHAIGTTVAVTHLFKPFPVRQRMARKDATACLKRIRALLQSSAVARPEVRFSLKVLPASSGKEWVYAPRSAASTHDALLKILGGPCIRRCTWVTASNPRCAIEALLPRPDADPSPVRDKSQFVVLNRRPLNSKMGFAASLLNAVKTRLKSVRSAGTLSGGVFMYLGVTTKGVKYDVTVEPGKDDVVFEDTTMILQALGKVLDQLYPMSAVGDAADFREIPRQEVLDVESLYTKDVELSEKRESVTPRLATIHADEVDFGPLSEKESTHTGLRDMRSASPKMVSSPVRGNIFGCPGHDNLAAGRAESNITHENNVITGRSEADKENFTYLPSPLPSSPTRVQVHHAAPRERHSNVLRSPTNVSAANGRLIFGSSQASQQQSTRTHAESVLENNHGGWNPINRDVVCSFPENRSQSPPSEMNERNNWFSTGVRRAGHGGRRGGPRGRNMGGNGRGRRDFSNVNTQSDQGNRNIFEYFGLSKPSSGSKTTQPVRTVDGSDPLQAPVVSSRASEQGLQAEENEHDNDIRDIQYYFSSKRSERESTILPPPDQMRLDSNMVVIDENELQDVPKELRCDTVENFSSAGKSRPSCTLTMSLEMIRRSMTKTQYPHSQSCTSLSFSLSTGNELFKLCSPPLETMLAWKQTLESLLGSGTPARTALSNCPFLDLEPFSSFIAC